MKALTADELVAHRLRGHVPYEPSCEICQSCRGVHKHRRRAGNKLSTEVFADFGFLSQEGLDESDKQSFKFLVIKEVFSSSIGAVVVSDEKVGEQQLISKWFGEFGLRNSAEEVSVVLLTDSESAVSSMVANVQGYQFLFTIVFLRCRVPRKPRQRLQQGFRFLLTIFRFLGRKCWRSYPKV